MTNEKFIVRLTKLVARHEVISVICISVITKLTFLVLFGGGLTVFPIEGSDNHFYYAAALNLLESRTYGNVPSVPTVGMPPGQSVYLALLYAIGSGSLFILKLGQILLLTAVALITMLTGRILLSRQLAFWSGILIAIDPAQAYLSATFLSEPIFIFLMALGLYLLIRHSKQAHLVYPLCAGVCFGLAGLTRNQGWLFALFLLLGSLLTVGRLVQLRTALVVAVMTAIVIAPWTYRNYQLTNEFIPVSAEGGLTLWASNNPDFVWRQPMPMSLPIYQAPDGLHGAEIDHYYRQQAIAWIFANPTRFALNGLRKIVALFHFDPMSARQEVSNLFRAAGLLPYGLMLPFILVGLAAHLRDRRLWILYAYILFTTLLSIVFWGDSRIRAPIQPYLYLFGVLGVSWVLAWRRSAQYTDETSMDSKSQES